MEGVTVDNADNVERTGPKTIREDLADAFRETGRMARDAATKPVRDARDKAAAAARARAATVRAAGDRQLRQTRKHRPSVYAAAAATAGGLLLASSHWFAAIVAGWWLFVAGPPITYTAAYRLLRRRAVAAGEELNGFPARRAGRRARRDARMIGHATAVYGLWLAACGAIGVGAATAVQAVALAVELAAAAVLTWWVCDGHWSGLAEGRRRLADLADDRRTGRHAAAPEPATDEESVTVRLPDEPVEEVDEPAAPLPPVRDLLQDTSKTSGEGGEHRDVIQRVLDQFDVPAKVTGWTRGPLNTRYEVTTGPGVQAERVLRLASTFQMLLGDEAVRLLVPVPGKPVVGVEVPNSARDIVSFLSVLDAIPADVHPLTVALGKSDQGQHVIGRVDKWPHLLMGGATGGGKSTCLNCILLSIISRTTPEQVRLILIDPKRVEFTAYKGIPHLLTEVVTDPRAAIDALAWLVREMDDRYDLFEGERVVNIDEYNRKMRAQGRPTLAYLLGVVDELADLVMVAAELVDDDDSTTPTLGYLFQRLGQLARAAGIHLIIATQRPAVDTIPNKIKGNLPSRLAFQTVDNAGSRVILDQVGAEQLTGLGDALYLPQEAGNQGSGKKRMIRMQCAYVTRDEVYKITDFLRENSPAPRYAFRCAPARRPSNRPPANGAGAQPAPVTRTTTEVVADMVVAIIAAEPGCDTARIATHEAWNHIGARPPSQPTLSRTAMQLEEEGHITRRRDGARWTDYQLTDKGRQRAEAAGLASTT